MTENVANAIGFLICEKLDRLYSEFLDKHISDYRKAYINVVLQSYIPALFELNGHEKETLKLVKMRWPKFAELTDVKNQLDNYSSK